MKSLCYPPAPGVVGDQTLTIISKLSSLVFEDVFEKTEGGKSEKLEAVQLHQVLIALAAGATESHSNPTPYVAQLL